MRGPRRQNRLGDSRHEDELNAALQRALHRILSWRVPPNWSTRDWSDEVKALIAAARCDAELAYDSARGVPLSAFLYQRALTCGWTRYRQEWAYALHFQAKANGDDEKAGVPCSAVLEVLSPEPLQGALMELPFADQWLIRQLFWNKTTEDKVATDLNISQQAVSKRKHKIICKLRRGYR